MKQLIYILVLSLSFGTASAKAQTLATFFDEADAVFSNFTRNGEVNYAGLKEDPTALNKALATAAQVSVSSANVNSYKAFWINAYNLAVIKGVLDNYPLNSPLDIKGFFDNVAYALGGSNITLNDIENKMLRAKFDDARIHFVLVCGAKGCPPIISESYRPSNLDEKLNAQTVKALNNPSFIQVSDGAVALSEIFKWYKEDFVKNGMDEIDYINQFRNDKISDGSEISYYPYNWSLNSR